MDNIINDLGYVCGRVHYDDEAPPDMPVLLVLDVDRAVQSYTAHGIHDGYSDPIEALLNYDL